MSWVSILEDNLKRLDGTFSALRKESSPNELLTRCESELSELRKGVELAKTMDGLKVLDLIHERDALAKSTGKLEKENRKLLETNEKLDRSAAKLTTDLAVARKKLGKRTEAFNKTKGEVKTLSRTIQNLKYDMQLEQEENRKLELRVKAGFEFGDSLKCPHCRERLFHKLVLPHIRECQVSSQTQGQVN